MADQQAVSNAIAQELVNERVRQVEVEDRTHRLDDGYIGHDLATAAACYTLKAAEFSDDKGTFIHRWWPWDLKWWKPSDPRRNLVKAGALIIAEIERLDRGKKTRV